MKKLPGAIVITLLFLFAFIPFVKASTFIAPPDTASDVITLINGKLIYCKVKSIGLKKVKYIPHGSNKDSVKVIKRELVFMVNYPDGTSWRVTSMPIDSLHSGERIRRYGPYVDISFSCGISSPAGTYGSSGYDVTEYQTGVGTICGFASPGFTANGIFSILVWKGWELTCMGDYVHNAFNAGGYLDEWAGLGGEVNFKNPTAIGTYSLNNYAFFCGISGNVTHTSKIYFDLRFLIGAFYLSIPSVQGTGYGNSLYGGNNGPIAINVPGADVTDMAMDLGATMGYKVLPYMRIVLNTDFIFAGGGQNNFENNPLGLNPYDPNVSMFNFTLGVQFEL